MSNTNRNIFNVGKKSHLRLKTELSPLTDAEMWALWGKLALERMSGEAVFSVENRGDGVCNINYVHSGKKKLERQKKMSNRKRRDGVTKAVGGCNRASNERGMPQAWGFDPVVGGVRKLLVEHGLGELLGDAKISRFHERAGDGSVELRILKVNKAGQGSWMDQAAADGPGTAGPEAGGSGMSGGAKDCSGMNGLSQGTDSGMRLEENGFSFGRGQQSNDGVFGLRMSEDAEGGEYAGEMAGWVGRAAWEGPAGWMAEMDERGAADSAGSPPMAVMIRGHLPMRMDFCGDRFWFSVLAYDVENGCRRIGRLMSCGEDNLETAIATARRGFIAARREMTFRDEEGLASVEAELGLKRVGSLPDEVWVGRQLAKATVGVKAVELKLLPVEHEHVAGELDVDGVKVRAGKWVWVRLEGRGGLVMTEAAILVGVEKMGAATRLVLKDGDGVVSTCWTRGPGWVRRVVPVSEANAWRAMAQATSGERVRVGGQSVRVDGEREQRNANRVRETG